MTNRATEPDRRQMAEDVLPAEIEDALPVKLDVLQPWHKPRKQYVRARQWMELSRRLIESRQNRARPTGSSGEGADTIIRYLTLPGIDYLDVRQLADVCRDLDCRLTSTGFLSGDNTLPSAHMARASYREEGLIKAGYITKDSHTFPFRFEEIAPGKGAAYRDLQRCGPFHIINIDACGSVARPTADHARRLIDAIYRTLEFQLKSGLDRWMLFVTADVRPNSLDPDTLRRLSQVICDNTRKNHNFRIEASSLFDCPAEEVEIAIGQAAKEAGQDFLNLFSLGISKWFLHLAESERWDMLTHNAYCYSTGPVGDIAPTLTSLAFEFRKQAGLKDRFKVTKAQPASGGPDQDTSVRAAKKIADMENVDDSLKSDSSLRAEMRHALTQWLVEAGYDGADVVKQIGRA